LCRTERTGKSGSYQLSGFKGKGISFDTKTGVLCHTLPLQTRAGHRNRRAWDHILWSKKLQRLPVGQKEKSVEITVLSGTGTRPERPDSSGGRMTVNLKTSVCSRAP